MRPEEALRPAPRLEVDALLLRLLELLVALRGPEDRHLLEALQRDDGHLGGAAAHRRARGVERLHQAGVGLGPEGGAERGHVLLAPDPQRGAGGVEGDEPAANHDHPAAQVHPVAAVRVEEVVDRLHDAVELDAREGDVPALLHADREEERLEALAAKLGQAALGGERRAGPERHAEREDLVDLSPDDAPREAVLRDPVAHHPARLLRRLEDR